MRLYDKIKVGDSCKKLVVPRVITIMQKCVEHKVQDCLIQRLHFNDLYVLLLSIDIANLKETIKQKQRAERKQHNIEVRDVSQNEALKFLKGG